MAGQNDRVGRGRREGETDLGWWQVEGKRAQNSLLLMPKACSVSYRQAAAVFVHLGMCTVSDNGRRMVIIMGVSASAME